MFDVLLWTSLIVDVAIKLAVVSVCTSYTYSNMKSENKDKE
jgi:hypothetical protein